MTIFTLLLLKLIPLYATIGLGYLAGRRLQVDRQSVANIIIYIVVPVIMFAGVLKARPTPEILLLPVITFLMAMGISLVFLKISQRIWKDFTPNILACAAGTGNTGYFGFPVAVALFDERTVGIYLVMILGVTVFESSWGFYIAHKGRHTSQEALRKVSRLPPLYGFLLGLFVYYAQLPVPVLLWDFVENMKGVYTILGMMIVGLSLAMMPNFKLDWKFTFIAFAAKFLVWPLLALAFIGLDNSFLHWYGDSIHDALILLSIVPMAANTVVIATLADTHPEKAAGAVVLSTFLALIFVPLMTMWLISN